LTSSILVEENGLKEKEFFRLQSAKQVVGALVYRKSGPDL